MIRYLNKFITTLLFHNNTGTMSISDLQLYTGGSLKDILESLRILERHKYIKVERNNSRILWVQITAKGRRKLIQSNVK